MAIFDHAHRAVMSTRSCGSFWDWLVAWWDSAPWLRKPPAEDRCIMGSPVDPSVHCRRRAVADTLWCSHHQPPDRMTRDQFRRQYR